jgi:glutamate/tyrosine decarboxylase-like PLP-dependent enzyme
MGIAADTLVAAFNPQLAAWSHSPLAAEIERHLVRIFGVRFGWSVENVDGVFASGGAEANHTALITALVDAFPDFSEKGVRALARQPVLYLSAHAHDSMVKAARFCGLGTAAVRQVPVDERLQLDTAALESMVKKDREAGLAPFMIAATAGTTPPA